MAKKTTITEEKTKKTTAKKTATKKASAKTATAAKTTVKKSAVKKMAVKKTATKKAAAKSRWQCLSLQLLAELQVSTILKQAVSSELSAPPMQWSP